MHRKGQVWISAVIYIGLGVVAITILVTAGVPLINKMRDRNTFIQTKELIQTIDRAITDIVSEGPGSRRHLDVVVRKGKLFFREFDRDTILWKMQTRAIVQEPNSEIQEGNVKLNFTAHPLLVDEYEAKIILDYFERKNIKLTFNGNIQGMSQPLEGKVSITLTHNGIDTGNKILVDIIVD